MNTLENAIKAARNEIAEAGLSAQRRIDNHGDISWDVSFGIFSFMTHMTDENVTDWTDAEIASFVADNWDEEWDEVQVSNPVGDFSNGSSDFKPRA